MNPNTPSWWPQTNSQQDLPQRPKPRFNLSLSQWIMIVLFVLLAGYAVFATMQWVTYQSQYNAYIGEEEEPADEEYARLPLVESSYTSAGGVVDEFIDKSTAVIYVCEFSSDSCGSSTEAINKATTPESVEYIFYTFDISADNKDDQSDADTLVQALKLLGDTEIPTLVYVKDGQVADRLTNFNKAEVTEWFASIK